MKLETQFKKTLKQIGLKKNERLLIALSGGKDSAVVAYLLKKFGYNIRGFHINLCVGNYSKKCQNVVKNLCKKLGIELFVYNLEKEQKKNMKKIWRKTKKKNLNNCSACGIMKKWIMNREARRLNFDKIVTGHNLDDEIQTFLINVFKASLKLSASSGPITKNISDKKFVSRIKPLYYILEKEILKYAKLKKLPFISGKCPYAEISYRIEVRNFLEKEGSKEKLNILKNAEKIYRKMSKKKFNNPMIYCEFCGEPSRKKICKKCSLLNG